MLSKKEKLIIKIVMAVLAITTIVLLADLLIESIVLKKDPISFFASHFIPGICLILVGIIAFLMPISARQKYSEGKGDDMMLVVSILLVLCGIVSFIWSFITL